MSYSVVVPTIGTRSCLGECVDGVLAQMVRPTDITVVGVVGMSRPAWLAPSVKFVTAPESSNGQRNAGAQLSKGRVVLFVDDDVILEPDFAAKLLQAWQDSAGTVVGAAGVISNDPWLAALPSFGYFLLGLGYTAFRATASRLRWSGHVRSAYRPRGDVTAGFLHGPCVAYDRDLALIEPFDETFDGYVMGGDLDMAARMRRRGRLIQVPEARCRAADTPTTGPVDPYRQGLWHGERLAYYRWRHRGPGILGTVCWMWANLGQVVVLAGRGIRSGSWSALRGYLAGLRATHRRISEGTCRRWATRPNNAV